MSPQDVPAALKRLRGIIALCDQLPDDLLLPVDDGNEIEDGCHIIELAVHGLLTRLNDTNRNGQSSNPESSATPLFSPNSKFLILEKKGKPHQEIVADGQPRFCNFNEGTVLLKCNFLVRLFQLNSGGTLKDLSDVILYDPNNTSNPSQYVSCKAIYLEELFQSPFSAERQEATSISTMSVAHIYDCVKLLGTYMRTGFLGAAKWPAARLVEDIVMCAEFLGVDNKVSRLIERTYKHPEDEYFPSTTRNEDELHTQGHQTGTSPNDNLPPRDPRMIMFYENRVDLDTPSEEKQYSESAKFSWPLVSENCPVIKEMFVRHDAMSLENAEDILSYKRGKIGTSRGRWARNQQQRYFEHRTVWMSEFFKCKFAKDHAGYAFIDDLSDKDKWNSIRDLCYWLKGSQSKRGRTMRQSEKIARMATFLEVHGASVAMFVSLGPEEATGTTPLNPYASSDSDFAAATPAESTESLDPPSDSSESSPAKRPSDDDEDEERSDRLKQAKIGDDYIPLL